MTRYNSSVTSHSQFNRRQWLCRTGLAGLAATGCTESSIKPPPYDAEFARFPEKVAMQLINDRAPQLETPWHYFKQDLTPNEAFFVRWHLQPIPTKVDVRTWRLRVAGHIDRPVELSLADLRAMPQSSLVAVCQCAGNSRKFFGPRVTGAQWGDGAMGNARWTGVKLGDLFDRVGLKAGAVDVTFDGLDVGPLPATPDFVKSLSIDHAREGDVLVAYEMNGSPLPLLNGFPARLVVPGWYATYWLKSLSEITVLPQQYGGYWMAKAYKIPAGDPGEQPDQLATDLVPISAMNVRSFWVEPNLAEPYLPAGVTSRLSGIAFDGGSGIGRVEISNDAGRSWKVAELGQDFGPYAFRRWHFNWTPSGPGTHRLHVRATAADGTCQPMKSKWNRGGYMRNVAEHLDIQVL